MDATKLETHGAALIAEARAVLDRVLPLLTDPATIWPQSAREHLALISELRRAESRLQSTVAVVIADADRRGVAERAAGTSITSWMTVTEKASPRDAAGVLFAGRGLNSSPAVKQAALAGDVTPQQARSIATVVDALPRNLTSAQREAASEILVGSAATSNPDQLRRMGQVVLDAVAPVETAEEAAERERRLLAAQRRRALRNRSLTFTTDDGSMLIRGSLPVLEGEEFVRIISAYRASAQRSGADRLDPLESPVTAAQRDADALLQLINDVQRRRTAPGVAGDRPRVVVVMREESLRERAEQAGKLATGERISAGDLRRLCCDADLLPVVLGSASEVLDVGREQRLVTPAMRRALDLRDGGCVFPGCNQRPEFCDAHHIVPWWAGGVTALYNLVLLCRHHHGMVEPQRFGDTSDAWVPDFDIGAPGRTLPVDGGGQGTTLPVDGGDRGTAPPMERRDPETALPIDPGDLGMTLPIDLGPQETALPIDRPDPGRTLPSGSRPVGVRNENRWEVRMNADGAPEFLPPMAIDPRRVPRRGVCRAGQQTG